MKVKDLLNKHQYWTKGVYYRDGKGLRVSDYREGVRCCLEGALMACYCDNDDNLERACTKVEKILREKFHYYEGRISFNDTKSFKDIQKLLRLANV